jgi:hypothetical protein
MASTSYLARVIYKEHTETSGATDFTGTYKLMVRAKSIPSPASAPNTVESTTMEDDTQTFETGIKTADTKQFTGNLEKEYFDALLKVEGKKCDIMQLYGTDGVGGVAKSCYVGQITPTVNDVGGVDEILEMTASVVPNTASKWVTDDFTVEANEDGTFTVTKKA